MTNNNIKEDEVHQSSDIKNTIYNKNISCDNISNINNDNDNNNTQFEKASWWLNELDSLGIKSNYDKNESNYIQNLEDLSDNKKQEFILGYSSIVAPLYLPITIANKACYQPGCYEVCTIKRSQIQCPRYAHSCFMWRT